MASLSTAYLILYNAAQSFGWAASLGLTLLGLTISDHGIGFSNVYSSASFVVGICQLSALLEVVHAATGLVRTGVLSSFLQWAGRSHVLFAVLAYVPEVQGLPSVLILFIAWSLSEIIRYPQYALSLANICPHPLLWLRYSAFIILYPIGVLAEMHIIVSALPFIQRTNLFSPFFGALGISYRHFLIGVLMVYPFVWLQLYLHLFHQRKSKLFGKGRKKAD